MDDLTSQSIANAFYEGREIETLKSVLELTLQGFTNVGMFERSDVLFVDDVFRVTNLKGPRTTIYHYRLKYLGQATSVIAYRDESLDISDPALLAYFNDTLGTCQRVTDDELIEFILSRPDYLDTSADLKDFAIRTNEARIRVAIAKPSGK